MNVRQQQILATTVALILAFGISLTASKLWKFFHLDSSGMSNSSINIIHQDRSGVIWIGTWDGLNRYDGNKYTLYNSILNDSTTLTHPVIRDIQEEDSCHLWIVTDGGINRFNKFSGHVQRYYLNSPKNTTFAEHTFHCAIDKRGKVVACFNKAPFYLFDKKTEKFVTLGSDKAIQGTINKLFFDKNGQLWAFSDNKVYLFALKASTAHLVAAIPLPEKTESLVADNEGSIWAQADKRILRLNTQHRFETTPWTLSDRLIGVSHTKQRTTFGTDNGLYFIRQGQKEHLLPNVSVTALLQGSQNILWVGTDGRGIYQYYAKNNFILSFPTGTKNHPVRAIQQLGDTCLIGTKGEGLLVYKATGKDRLQPIATHNVGPGRSYNAVYALGKGSNNRIWVGTDGKGLQYYQQGQLHKMTFRSPQEEQQVYSVYSIIQANDSTLYIGTSGNGLVCARFHNDTITKVMPFNSKQPRSLQSDVVYAQVYDPPYLWVGMRGGGLMRLNTANNSQTFFRNDGNDGSSIVSNDVITLYKDSRKRLWIGTTQGLDLLVTKGKKISFHHVIDSHTAAFSKNIHNLQEDIFHNIWASTSSGIVRIQPNLTLTNFTHKDGLQGDEFSDGAGLSCDGGRKVFFGGTNGISILFPTQMQNTGFMPTLLLNGIRMDNQPVTMQKEVSFPNGTKNIEFSFSILDYIDNSRCELAYKLEHRRWFGSDNNDIYTNVGSSKSILLNELLPGHYQLYVKQSNSAHQWSSKPLVISFNVEYPLWGRWWAITIYLLVIAFFIRSVYRVKKRRLQRHHRHEMERQSQRNREDIHHAKLRFFSNVTGKFSNSLTQIYDAIEHIRENKGQPLNEELMRIEDSARLINRHIKQLSEIQSAEEYSSTLHPEPIRWMELIKLEMDAYSVTLLDRNIHLALPEKPEATPFITDKTVAGKMVRHLLDYIMPSIEENSSLEISIEPDCSGMSVSFCYRGESPSTDEQATLFNSFRALDNFENNMSAGKTDKTIGLTLCNDLAKQLGGKMTIQTAGQQETVFKIEVPELSLPQANDLEEQKSETALQRIFRQKTHTVLLIENDTQMAHLMTDALSENYSVIGSSQDSYKSIAASHAIDIVVVDTCAGDLSAINDLRTDPHTRYVPIIAICNEGEKDNIVNTLRMGANTILEKPFHVHLFTAMVERTILESDKMRDLSFLTGTYIHQYDGRMLSDEAKQFITNAVNVISEHYQDENYNPSSLARDMAISRSQLYRKMKTTINVSPVDFILEYRMQLAERLLKGSTKTVSEVITLCGFRNRSFFYREFARRYNCLPKEFRQQTDKQ